jgi:hypothetical protein
MRLLRAFENDEWAKVVELAKLNREHHPNEAVEILRRNNKIEVWHD